MMRTSTKLLSVFSAFCALFFLGFTVNAQSITVSGGVTAIQIAQALGGTNVTVTNATITGGSTASGSFNQGTSTFPLSDGIILTSGPGSIFRYGEVEDYTISVQSGVLDTKLLTTSKITLTCMKT
jgi:hypothetical protein